MKTKRKPTTSTTLPGGTFKLADDLILTRMGYGAMQLAGPHVFGINQRSGGEHVANLVARAFD
jgi:hypothetical protein